MFPFLTWQYSQFFKCALDFAHGYNSNQQLVSCTYDDYMMIEDDSYIWQKERYEVNCDAKGIDLL